MIDKLEYLIALAQAQHFGRAAEASGITQPTLSAGLKQLEEQLGVLLVNRGSRFQGFTPEGERVLDWARRIVGDTRAMRDEVRTLRHGLSGHLRIASVPTALPSVARLTTPYRALHPGVSFTVLSRNSLQVLDLIENLEADVGLTYLDNEPLGRVRAVPIYHEYYCLITAPDSPLGDRSEIAWRELSDVPLCLLTPDMQNRRIIDRFLREAGATPRATLESNSMIVLLTHVRTGEWATVMPSVLAETFDAGGGTLRIVPVTGATPPTIGLVYPQREPLPPQTAAMVVEARKLAAEMEELTGTVNRD
jgi:DNA-binding transcriptional LysR family regulator